MRLRICLLVLVAILFGSAARLRAQSPTSARHAPALDLGITYIADRTLKANTNENFWIQGGSIELGADAWKGLGIAANVTGTHAKSVGTTGVPLSLVTVTFGPRYRWHAERKLSVYGEALVGEADGFYSLFPGAPNPTSNANSLALQFGGAVDYRLNKRFAVRCLDVGFLRTQLPNSTDNVQNILRLGAGLVVKF